MTKMLADIACNTPEGIELEQVRITPNRTFTVNGRAIPADDRSATEVVTLMQDHLRQSGIFNEITLNWGDSDSFGHYSFELTARLHRPYFQYEYPVELDFGKYTMVDRRDGRMPGESGSGGPLADALAMNELGSASDAAARSLEMKPDQPGSRRGDDGSDFRAPGNGRTNIDRSAEQAERLADAGTAREVKPPAADSEKLNRSSGPSGSRISRPFSPGRTPYGDAGRIGDGSESVTMPPSEQIPEPLTEQQVNAMSVSEAREALLKVSTARRYARHRSDEELKERLEREFDWLMNRMRAGGGDS